MPAILFDCDGVLSDTEQYGHRRAFNTMFEEYGLPVHWSPQEYADKVQIAGGKERIRSILSAEFIDANHLPHDEKELEALVRTWHQRKTDIYTSMVTSGELPPRPGVRRLVGEAIAAGWSLAVASTSAETSVRAVLEHSVGSAAAAQFSVFAGDIVPKKKPAPDIYLLAMEKMSATRHGTIVIEDSANGLRSALSAGLPVLVTQSSYTGGEDFTGAELVVSSLGDDSQPTSVIANPRGLDIGSTVTLNDISRIIEA